MRKKISISLDEHQLRLARKAAKSEGLALSAYIGRALAKELEDSERRSAARELVASWGAHGVPTSRERDEFLAQVTRSSKRRTRAA